MSNSVDKLLRKAKHHINAGEPAQAKEIYKHVLSRFPKNKKALQSYKKLSIPTQIELDKLISLFSSGKLEECVIFGQDLADKFPNAPILYEVLGAAYLGLENDKATIKYYRKLLRVNPKHTDAFTNLGMIFYKVGEFEKAVESYQQAVEIEPNFADAHYNLGNALRQTGNLSKAFESYRKSLLINPNDAEVLTNYGHALRDYGALDQAIEYYVKVLKINPSLTCIQAEIDSASNRKNTIDSQIQIYQKISKTEPKSADTIFFKAALYDDMGYHEFAVNCYEKVLKIKPEHALAHYGIGVILKKKANYKEAIKKFKQAITFDPNSADSYYYLSNAQMEEEQLEAAIENCKIALELRPDWAELINLIGTIQLRQGSLDAALANFEQAISIKPNFDIALNNGGIVQTKKGDLQAALESHKQAIKANPESSKNHFNAGAIFRHIGDLESSIESYGEAVKIDPKYYEAHWNQSLAYLHNEDFQNGWAKYEARWQAVSDMRYLTTVKPLWRFDRRQRVLVWAEQGLGDEIMFASSIREAHALCSKLIIKVDERLIPLFKRSFPDDIDFRIKSKHVSENEYDFHLPMGSLPLRFRRNDKDFKSTSQGWLVGCNTRATSLRKKLTRDGSEILIGISWQSTRPREGVEAKVISLAQLAKKLHGPKIKLVNLQYGEVSKELDELRVKTKINVVQLHEIDNKEDIDDLASLILACDRIVSISNLTIHLAGALGKEANVLLPFSSDWRWGKSRNSTLWYDSVRLHRQSNIFNWDTALTQL